MIKAILVDDEEDALVTMERFLRKWCPEITIIAKANGVRSAVEVINRTQPDILFLDVNMRDGTGFDVLEQVSDQHFKTIFTTAYDEYAIKAFEVKAFQYLLKPINPLKLQSAVQDAIAEISVVAELKQLQETIANFTIEKVGLPVKDKIELTRLDDILRLESESNYTKIYLKDNTSLLVAKTLGVFEEILSDKSFKRVHQSHIVNINCVTVFNQKESVLSLSNDDVVPVSRRHKTELAKTLGMRIV